MTMDYRIAQDLLDGLVGTSPVSTGVVSSDKPKHTYILVLKKRGYDGRGLALMCRP